jgi:TonB family protein
MFRIASLCVVFSSLAALGSTQAQVQVPEPPPKNASAAVVALYPDSTSGLEHLVKDIMKAQKSGDGVHAQALIDSLILPDYERWYLDVFDDEMAEAGIAAYKANLNSLPAQIANSFLTVQQLQASVTAVRFDENCDDNAGDRTFGILLSRLRPVPLYELRFIKDGKFSRIFAMVYVDGGFRYVPLPDPGKVAPHADDAPSHPSPQAATVSPASPTRIRQGGTVTAASLIHKEQPVYPEIARREGIQGTIRLHAIIGKDGTVHGLRVMSGACSLSRSAYEAVKKWRYRPTTLNGTPVEVDTTLDVFFSLSR